MPQVKITSDGLPNNTHIFVDGVELKSVQSITYSIDCYRKSRLIIELIDAELELCGEFHNRLQTTPTTNIANNCTCDTMTLISKGCQCGGN